MVRFLCVISVIRLFGVVIWWYWVMCIILRSLFVVSVGRFWKRVVFLRRRVLFFVCYVMMCVMYLVVLNVIRRL